MSGKRKGGKSKGGGRVTPPSPARLASAARVRIANALADWPDDLGVEHNCRPTTCAGVHLVDGPPCVHPPEWTCRCGRRWTRTPHGWAPKAVVESATLSS